MKRQKSLRQLAREFGVSPSYLSQVKHGKRPASASLQEKLKGLKGSVKQNVKQSVKISMDFISGGVPELVDGHDLGSCAARRRSSSLLFPTT